MSHQTYQLKKDDKIIMETQSVTVERAVDYFIDIHPDFYDNFKEYNIVIKPKPTPSFEHLDSI